jgi:DNA primase
MISKDTIALVRERADIVVLVRESVPTLKKQGRRYVGLCPFHKEKSPSFSVNADSGVYHCFGCKESGDAISFLERTEGYTFTEAVRALAERFGVTIEEDRHAVPTDADRHKKEREELYGVMNIAAGFYEEQLRTHPQRQYALDELARRDLKLDNAAVQAFRVGYAPPGWDGLVNYLKKQGVSPAVAETLGLIAPRSNGSGYYDRFRHRLMFAVSDVRGRVVAFSGRVLAPMPGDEDREKPPKYINSPETPIYVKGTHLFGLWQGRNAIRQEERAVLVEGNFDVVSLHARGVENVVGSLGTAFTVEQARLLRRHALDVTLFFDGDEAGRKAARAAEAPCDEVGLDAKVAILPDRTDPDEFVRTKGPEALRHLLGTARGILEYLIEAELDASFNAADSMEKAARVERLSAMLARKKDSLRREMLEEHANRVAQRLDIVLSSPNAFAVLKRRFLTAAGASRINRGPRPSEARVSPRPPGSEERKAIAGAILDFPALLDDSGVQPVLPLLEGNSARIVAGVAQHLRTNERGEKVLDTAEFLAQMTPAIKTFASARLAAPQNQTIEEARETVASAAKSLRDTNVAREAGELVREQERIVGDWESGLELLKQASELTSRRLKGSE